MWNVIIFLQPARAANARSPQTEPVLHRRDLSAEQQQTDRGASQFDPPEEHLSDGVASLVDPPSVARSPGEGSRRGEVVLDFCSSCVVTTTDRRAYIKCHISPLSPLPPPSLSTLCFQLISSRLSSLSPAPSSRPCPFFSSLLLSSRLLLPPSLPRLSFSPSVSSVLSSPSRPSLLVR